MNALRRSVWNLWLRATGNAREAADEIRQWHHLDADEARRQQSERLKRLLIHSYRHVPHYRDVLQNAGVVQEETVDLAKFDQIPLLDKQTLTSESDRLRSDDLRDRDWFFETSGGSTGTPVRFIQDSETADWGRAIKSMFNAWSGYQYGEPRIRLWGSERDIFQGQETLKTRVGRWVRNETFLNAFRMGPEDMDRFVQEINQVRPVQILAYVESIYDLAVFIRENDRVVHSPASIMTSAGKLHEDMRETIESVFEAPCFDRYGSREVGDIACECRTHDGLHVSVPTHYVEVLRPDGMPAAKGETGEIVITLLTNRSMPLIRYRIGDMAVQGDGFGTCACGCTWPKLQEVTGRVSDTFTTAAGARVHGEYFTHLFYFRDWVQTFQVIQESPAHIRVRIVPHRDISDSERKSMLKATHQEDLGEIRSKIQTVMGEECTVDFVVEDEILPSASGKYRYTISNVTSNDGLGGSV
jgi:phenylacetate-CoA ligase